MNYLAGASTFVVAILTLFYVLTTNKQLHVTSRQLEEMKRSRELQNQPFPWIESIEFYIEKPRLYFSPPRNHEILARQHCLLRIKNIGSCPAISIHIEARIIVPKSKGENTILKPATNRIDILEEKSIYPPKNKKMSFMFNENIQALLLNNLLENKIKLFPVLEISIIFRNIAGAIFQAKEHYLLYPKEKHNSAYKQWLSILSSFPIENKELIDRLDELKAAPLSDWRKHFTIIENKLSRIIGKKDLFLDPWPLPFGFELKQLSTEQYQHLIKNTSYSIKIPPNYKCPSVK